MIKPNRNKQPFPKDGIKFLINLTQPQAKQDSNYSQLNSNLPVQC